MLKILLPLALLVSTLGAQSSFTSGGAIVVSNTIKASPYPAAGSCTANNACVDVTGLTGTITNVSVTLTNVTLTGTANVAILLESPGGGKLDILSNACRGSGTQTFTLTDQAATSAVPGPATNCITTGSWKPTNNHFTGFSADNFPSPGPGTTGYTRSDPDSNATGVTTVNTGTFGNVFAVSSVNATPNGTWKLWVTNQASSGVTGQIGSWTITVTTSTPTAPSNYCAPASASTTTYTCTVTGLTTYYAGLVVPFIPDVTNTAPSTVNLTTLGAKTVQKLSSGVLANLSSGDLVAGVVYLLRYNGTVFIVDPGSGGSGVTSVTGGSSGTILCSPTTGAVLCDTTSYIPLLNDANTFSGANLFTGFVSLIYGINYAADSQASDTYVITLSPAITSYQTGAHYTFRANTANTGAATININALGAKTIVKVAGGVSTTLVDNDIRSGQMVDLVYDGTNMQLQSLLGNAPSTSTSQTANIVATIMNTQPVVGAGGFVPTSNRIYCGNYTPPITQTVSHMMLWQTVGIGAGDARFGIYSLAGGLLVQSGASSSSGNYLSATLASATTLTAGTTYSLCFSTNDGTLQATKTFSAQGENGIYNLFATNIFYCTNAMSGTTLNATCGSKTAITSSDMMWLAATE